MSNKLSKKQLDLLIERVLSERVNLGITTNYDADPKNVEFASGTDKLTFVCNLSSRKEIAKSFIQHTLNQQVKLLL